MLFENTIFFVFKIKKQTKKFWLSNMFYVFCSREYKSIMKNSSQIDS